MLSCIVFYTEDKKKKLRVYILLTEEALTKKKHTQKVEYLYTYPSLSVCLSISICGNAFFFHC